MASRWAIWRDDAGVWLDIDGELLGPYDTEEEAEEVRDSRL